MCRVPEGACASGVSLRVFRIAADVLREERDPILIPFCEKPRRIKRPESIGNCVGIGDTVPQRNYLQKRSSRLIVLLQSQMGMGALKKQIELTRGIVLKSSHR